jgi:hypothetical protein
MVFEVSKWWRTDMCLHLNPALGNQVSGTAALESDEDDGVLRPDVTLTSTACLVARRCMFPSASQNSLPVQCRSQWPFAPMPSPLASTCSENRTTYGDRAGRNHKLVFAKDGGSNEGVQNQMRLGSISPMGLQRNRQGSAIPSRDANGTQRR